MTSQRAATAWAILGMMVLCPLVTNADDGASRVTTRPLPGLGRPVVAKTDSGGDDSSPLRLGGRPEICKILR